MSQRVTLKDVAEHAGVARATASHVLNGRGNELRISVTTQKRIWQSAQHLAYRVNVAARSTIRQSTGCMGVLAPRNYRLDDSWTEQLLGVNRAAVEHDHYLIFVAHDELQLSDPTYLPKLLREHLVEGIIILMPCEDCVTLGTAAQRYGIPLVWTRCQRAEDAVGFDNIEPGRTAVRHFAEYGHERIVLVESTSQILEQAELRLGYEQAMNAAKLTPRVDSWNSDQLGTPAEAEKIWTLLNPSDRPTAILSSSTLLAQRIVAFAQSWGLRIPQDLSIITLGQKKDCSRSVPELAHWSQPLEEAGYTAANMLLNKMKEGNAALPSRVLQGAFHAASSICKVPAEIRRPKRD